ncbi:MAG: sigma-54 dependent transcriptional regulator [Proteobacteria bacterium]|nr:sigma-54 dependent transcriptional regulator [Pseudomonadota bacterium]
MRAMTVLVVDDEKVQRETLASILTDEGYQVLTAGDVPAATQILRDASCDIVLTDFRMPGGTGLDIARNARELCPESVSLIMTAYADVQGVIEAMRMGVLDYLLKPLNVDSLLARLAIIRDRRDLQLEVNFLRSEMNRNVDRGTLLGHSQAMLDIHKVIEQVAATRGTVLITGESGTGKEVVARTIHRMSAQAANKFVAINCGALPENLLESELFGHKKGAFTGAIADKAGLFAVANEGTLFLDEIGDMPKNLQVKLLRALQEREITPVGDTKPIKVNLRVVAATNRDLAADIAQNTFRQDLFYRLNVVELKMPPLRERPDDIAMLARHFIEKYTKELGKPMRPLSNEACRTLVRYSWPGNVRELENIIERAIILSKSPDRIDVEDLPASLHQMPLLSAAPSTSIPVKLDEAVRQFSRDHILNLLTTVDGDKKEAAKALGMSLSSLYRKLEELEIVSKRTDDVK